MRKLTRRSIASAAAAVVVIDQARAASPGTPVTDTVAGFSERLSRLPRRRSFTSVPVVLDDSAQWDAEALDAVLNYAGGPKQAWDNSDLQGPWLKVMRNSLAAQVHAFRHPNFLCVSATHGTAQLALYDGKAWDKYGLAKLAGAAENHWLSSLPAALSRAAPSAGSGCAVGPAPSVEALQRQGVVFLACHNAAWELADRLVAAGAGPAGCGVAEVCADLTNHLVPGVILTPGAVATLVELAGRGFAYAR